MEIIGIIAISVWVVSIVGFVIWNLYDKNKRMEDALQDQNEYIRAIRNSITDLDYLVNRIDTTIWVQSDPELLQTFEAIKNLSVSLKQFNTQDGI